MAVYAPPKSGKSSMIQQTLMSIRIKGFQFTVGEFNLVNIRDGQTFLSRYGSTVLRAVAVSPGEYEDLITRYFQGTHWVFDCRAYEEKDIILSANWELDDNDIQAVLSLPFKISKDKGTNLILIMDEFQNVLLPEEGKTIDDIERSTSLKTAELLAILTELEIAGLVSTQDNFQFYFDGAF